ncbi:TrkH family potassium uptake protein [Larsenimonas suaedae]|uniref:Trk system potassium uptake protein n=1 Tax=Larsenimonas suaedae TaxID=1851019 RepID=A0ABU1GWF4_9GAMM|nr:TrkH family potassium uptake protein [Larsenimonas suaedae]MCM2971058.1 TrkH family potassium uptake protein [Larsenimonas suaedae]MDR5895767.1 TrkH family potassium uptake protein [Larsenimonas suaedae]
MSRLTLFQRATGVGPVLRILAMLLLVLAVIMAVPLVVLIIEQNSDLWAFVYAELVTLVSAGLMLLVTRQIEIQLKPRQMFILTTLSWVTISTYASLPLVFGAPHLSMGDAVFESVSAVTTTGSTVMVGIDNLSDGLKLWRGLLQWVGGIGIIVMAIAILPFLQVGGMRLFQTESSDWSDKILPRAGGVAKSITVVYLLISVIAIVGYWLAGMTPLDAVVHGMSSVATGGFSNYDSSFGIYEDKPWIMWMADLFMLLGAVPFVLYIKMMREKTLSSFWKDQQVRGLLYMLVVVILGLTVYRVVRGVPFFDALTQVAFNVISVVTTTGYASDDYTLWGPLAIVCFFYLTFVGGCSGSTSGGMKVFRFQIGIIMLINQLRHLVHSNGVFAQRYNGRMLTDDVIRAVIAFSFFFFFTVGAIALGLAAMGLDLVTALSGAATAVANVGPGLGDTIGPAGNFSSLPEAAKWLLSFGMLMGRLEILTVLVLVTPMFWRK